MKKTMIRVDESTYCRLFALKKNYSFNEYISEMTSYFERNNINPFNVQSLPSEQLSREHERIIKILKAQEKKYSDTLKVLSDNVFYLKKIFGEVSEFKDNVVPDLVLKNEGITYEDLAAIAESTQGNVSNEKLRGKELEEFAEISRIIAVLENIKSDGAIVSIGTDTLAYRVGLSYEKQLLEVNKRLSTEHLRVIAFKGIVNEMTMQQYEKIPHPKDKGQEHFLVFKTVLDGVLNNLEEYNSVH